MSRHTPGPWSKTNRLISDDQPMIEIGADDDSLPTGRRSIAEVWVDTSNVELDEANARLITSAPHLLAALQELERLTGTILQEDDDAVLEARTAIKEALGE